MKVFFGKHRSQTIGYCHSNENQFHDCQQGVYPMLQKQHDKLVYIIYTYKCLHVVWHIIQNITKTASHWQQLSLKTIKYPCNTYFQGHITVPTKNMSGLSTRYTEHAYQTPLQKKFMKKMWRFFPWHFFFLDRPADIPYNNQVTPIYPSKGENNFFMTGMKVNFVKLLLDHSQISRLKSVSYKRDILRRFTNTETNFFKRYWTRSAIDYKLTENK